ncbi:pantetheine-phosphate adenylyltransferase [bacterium]|nr:pantetheine-phosphate adenylyltransferase [bacterium]
MQRIALYPGSFDPLTNGHVNIIERGLALCDELVVAIVHNPNKAPMFTVEERMEILREVFPDERRVRLTTFSGLLVNYAREVQANSILRGLRAVADFEYEYQMANMNRREFLRNVSIATAAGATACTYDPKTPQESILPVLVRTVKAPLALPTTVTLALALMSTTHSPAASPRLPRVNC